MGCCDNKCGCEKTSKRKIPWFTVGAILLGIVVVLNWQW